MDIFEQIAAIPAMSAFNAEGLAEVPIQQRVQDFLTRRIGGEWGSATIFVWTMPTGQPLYLAIGPSQRSPYGVGLTVVGEREDGTLAIADPEFLDVDGHAASEYRVPMLQIIPNRKAQSEAAIGALQDCLSEILPALGKIREFLKQSDELSQYRKRLWRHALLHAAEHLEDQLEEVRGANDA